MPPFINLAGRKFNRLTVLKRASNLGKHVCWLCKCDCGKKTRPTAFALKDGSSQSCGCLAIEMATGPRPQRPLKKDPLLRFESSYIPEPNSGCWLWLGTVDSGGYGIFPLRKRRGLRATHFSFEAFKGPIPKGHIIRHTCDLPGCVNPDHLLSGTVQDNSDDARRRGRLANGERINTAKLTATQIKAIRKDSRNLQPIANDYGVTKQQIFHIKKKISWKHIP